VRLVPIRYCADVAAAVRFYEVLGLDRSSASRPGSWVELTPASALLAVHKDVERSGDCELAVEAEEPLEAVAARLVAAGYAPEPIVDENFGRSMRVADPDGAWVQVNEFERELYT